MLNQRQLIPISNDVNSLKALTRIHFIVGNCKNIILRVFLKEDIDYR